MSDKSRRGFASMDPVKHREIASKGGRTAQAKGTAHRWTPEEAREAGRKGGLVSGPKPSLRKQEEPAVVPVSETVSAVEAAEVETNG